MSRVWKGTIKSQFTLSLQGARMGVMVKAREQESKTAELPPVTAQWPEWLTNTDPQCPDTIEQFWDELPPLCDKFANPIAPAIVFGLLQELKQGYTYTGAQTIPFQPSKRLTEVVSEILPASLERFCGQLVKKFFQLQVSDAEYWPIGLCLFSTKPFTVDALRQELTRSLAKQKSNSFFLLSLLGQMKGALALEALSTLIEKSDSASRMIVFPYLNEIVETEVWTRDDLLDRLITNPFENNQPVEFEIGGKKAWLRVTGVNQWQTTNEKNRVIRSLPAGGTQEALKETERARYKAYIETLKRVSENLTQWLELWMVHGRSWAMTDFVDLFLQQPIRFVFAQSLVWQGRVSSPSPLKTYESVRVTSEKTLHDQYEQTVDPLLFDEFRIAHPSFINSDELVRWATIFEANHIEQPFKQLMRPIYEEGSAHANFNSPVQLDGYAVTRVLYQRGWRILYPGASSNTSMTRHFSGYGVVARISSNRAFLGSVSNLRELAAWQGPDFFRDVDCHEPIFLSNVPALVVDECGRDIDAVVDELNGNIT